MSGSFSKEQRRNLVKAVGSTAFEAMEQARQLAYLTETRGAAMAKEFLSFEKTTRETVERQDAQLQHLEKRCNGLGEWCETNETQADQVLRELATLRADLDGTRTWIGVLESDYIRNRAVVARLMLDVDTQRKALAQAGLLARLAWLLFGRQPVIPRTISTDERVAALVAEGQP